MEDLKFRVIKVDFDSCKIMYQTQSGFFSIDKSKARIYDKEKAEFFLEGELSDPRNDNLNGYITIELVTG